ncbi:hypothetical protein [Streptomyces sp. NPDC020597]|uniref:hypothetical protein n=1 Tax=unclassified Streptomyces TaxID=2593676 RepID=UPI0037B15349
MFGTDLTFPMQHQYQTHWCWAATAVSTAAYYDAASPWIQCLVVDDEFGTTTCCEDGSTAECNKRWYLDRALKRVGHYVKDEAGPAPLRPTVVGEIDAHRPLAAQIDWSGGGTHFPVVSGYAEIPLGDEFPYIERWLTIQDPAYGQSAVEYDTFRTAYQGSGSWTWTYYTG